MLLQFGLHASQQCLKPSSSFLPRRNARIWLLERVRMREKKERERKLQKRNTSKEMSQMAEGDPGLEYNLRS